VHDDSATRQLDEGNVGEGADDLWEFREEPSFQIVVLRIGDW
jgi:hypothetical protein